MRKNNHRLPLAVAGLVIVVAIGFTVINRRRQLPVEQAASLGKQTIPDDLPPTVLYSTGTIPVGGSMAALLDAVGISPVEALAVARAIKPVFDPRYVKVGDFYELYRSSANTFVRLKYWPSSFEYYNVERKDDGKLASAKRTAAVEETVMGAAGALQTSLWEAMTSQGVPPDTIMRFADLFAWRVDFLTEPRAGDTFKVVWVQRQARGSRFNGEVLYATYRGHATGEVFGFRVDEEYYDLDGRSLRDEFLRAPLSYSRISSYFSRRRYHPVLRYNRPHHGIDYAAPRGTPVQSVGRGVVIAKGWDGGLGNAVRIRHSGDYVSIYGHLSRFPKGLRVGQTVPQGAVIGYVGATGLATGPHLHFGFKKNNVLVNFLGLKLSGKSPRVPAKDKARYEAIRKEGLEALARLRGNTSAPEALGPAKHKPGDE